MALDNNFFDNIKLRLVDGKYYDADEVKLLLEDIEQQFVLTNAENRLLHAQLSDDGGGAVEIFFSAQELASRTLEQTRVQAGKIIEQARKQAREIENQAYEEAERIKLESSSHDSDTSNSSVSQEFVLQCVEQCFNRLRKQHKDSLDIINEQWQSFLSGLMPEGTQPITKASAVETKKLVTNPNNICSSMLEKETAPAKPDKLAADTKPIKPEERPVYTPPVKQDKPMLNATPAKQYSLSNADLSELRSFAEDADFSNMNELMADTRLEDDDDTDEISMLTKKVNTIANELSGLVGKKRQGL